MSAPTQPATWNLEPATLKNYLELVKFSHTIFALPFALAAMLVAAQGFPNFRVFAWILVAMIAARTAAMGFNRIVDRHIDAQNPRTQNRELPSGKVSLRGAKFLVVFASLAFFFASFQLNSLALILAPLTLATLFFYSFCKRFTPFSHFVLGLCLGIAPVGAWVAVTGQIALAPCLLCAAILLWVAGFDIIYATMDADFDQDAGLHSMVQRLGIARALNLAKWLHAAFLILLFAFGFFANLGAFFAVAVAFIGAFLAYEHALVRPDDLRRVNAAFFTVNGVISVFFLIVVAGIVFSRLSTHGLP